LSTLTPPANTTDDKARLLGQLKALADPVRLRMLQLMAAGRGYIASVCCPGTQSPSSKDTGGICTCEFVEILGIPQPTVSYHLKALNEAGLVLDSPRGRWTYYSINPQALQAALDEVSSLLLQGGIHHEHGPQEQRKLP